jgi:hypothetical protein
MTVTFLFLKWEGVGPVGSVGGFGGRNLKLSKARAAWDPPAHPSRRPLNDSNRWKIRNGGI